MAKWPSDRELEEIYRRGSESYDFPYNTQAWDDMTLLLKKERRRKIFILFFFGMGLALLSGLVYLSIHKDPDYSKAWRGNIQVPEQPRETDDKASMKSFATDEPGARVVAPTTPDLKNEQQDVINTKLENTGINDIQVNNSKVKTEKNGETQNLNKTSKSPDPLFKNFPDHATRRELQSAKASERPVTESDQLEVIKLSPDKNNEVKNLNQNQLEKSNPSIVNSTILNEAFVYGKFNLIHKLSIREVQVERERVVLSIKLVQPQDPDRDNKFSRYGIDFFSGAASSWTPKGEYSSIDLTFGIGASYFSSKKISFSIGANYISDFYTAKQGDYHPPKGYWSGKGAPIWTAATCRILEASVGGSYDFNGIDHNGIALGINLVSTFLISEMYYYHYTEQDDNFNSSWTMANSTWLSSISITPTYGTKLSDNWNLQAGPYIQIPINGIGHGKIMLSSIGLRARVSFFPN